MEKVHQQGKMCTTGAEAKASRQQVQDMISDVTTLVKKCKDKLTKLEDSNEDVVDDAEVGLDAHSDAQLEVMFWARLELLATDA